MFFQCSCCNTSVDSCTESFLLAGSATHCSFPWLPRFQRAPCFYCRMRQVQQLAQPVARCLTPLCPLPDRPVATPCSKAPLQAMQPPMQHLTPQTYPPGPGIRPPLDPPGRALLEALLGLLEGRGLPFLLGGLSLSMATY